MRSPDSPGGLRATILTCGLLPETSRVDSSALERLTSEQTVFEIREHAFTHAGQPLLVFVVVYAASSTLGEPAPIDPSSQASEDRPSNRRRGEQLRVPAIDKPLYDRLCAWRNAEAKALGKPGYVLFRNTELAEVASRRPASLAALQEIHGIGSAKAERFGPALLRLLRPVDPASAPTELVVQDHMNADGNEGEV